MGAKWEPINGLAVMRNDAGRYLRNATLQRCIGVENINQDSGKINITKMIKDNRWWH